MGRFRRLFGRGGDEDADQQGKTEGRGANIMTEHGEHLPGEPIADSSEPGDHGAAPPEAVPPLPADAEAPAERAAHSDETPDVPDTTPAVPATDAATETGDPAPAPAPAVPVGEPAAADVAPAAPTSVDTPQFLDRTLLGDTPPDEAHAPEVAGEPSIEPDVVQAAEPQPAGDTVDSPSSWLTAGSKVGNRYTVVRELTTEAATELLGSAPPVSNATLYAVDDRMGYERCWSCGSTDNDQSKRFCVDCGAPQHREAVLARTLTPTGVAEEFQEGGSYYHVVHPKKQFGSSGVSLEVGAFSAEGPHHPNEDSYWTGLTGGCYDSCADSFGVLVLADGMGGYAPGSGLISKSIVTTVGRGIFDLLLADPRVVVDESSLHAIVHGAIATANANVLDQIRVSGDMGATLVVAIVSGQMAYVANIGDSRAYYLSPSGAVAQITRDQSLVEQQVALGQLSPDAVYTAVGNNVILHAVGEEAVEDVFDWYTQPIEPGSHVMLCSDGYWKTMQHAVWDVEIATAQSSLRSLARAMVENALANNTDDNTTVVLVGVD